MKPLTALRVTLPGIIIALILPLISSAQTIQQPAHPLKVFVNTENSTLFWPQQLPFYVRLSTGPDVNAPSFLLQDASVRPGSDARKSQAAAAIPTGGKLDLEMSGNQFMRWVNHATKDTFMLRFVSDGVSPKTQLTFSGAPSFTAADGTVFYGRGLLASLKSTDEQSGVAATYLSIDGASFSAYVNPLQFSLEKKNLLAFYALDNTGNAETMQTRLFTVDLTPPSTRHALSGLFQATILSPAAAILLTASDNLSGVQRIEYAFDKGAFSAYPGRPVAMADLEDGEHTFRYKSIDQVTNVEDERTFQFYLDRLPPVPLLSWETDFHKQGTTVFVSTRTSFKLASTDNKSGVKQIFYAVDGGNDQPFAQAFQLSAKSGARVIRYGSTDQMDNTSKPVENAFEMDVTAPKTTFGFEGVHYTSRNIHWITSKTGVVLKATDSQAGVRSIGYTTAPKASESMFDKPFFMPNEGPFTLAYGAVDNVSNKEAVQSIRVIVDNTAPVISINFGSGKIGSQSDTKNESVLDVYPSGAQVYLAATDASSGLKQITFALNGKTETPYSQPVVLNQPGEYTLTVSALDNTENKSVSVLRFFVSDNQ
jgi:hypothetical protein